MWKVTFYNIYLKENNIKIQMLDMEELELDIKFPSQQTSKKALAEKLAKKHEEKNQWFENIKKRKLLEKAEAEEETKSKKDSVLIDL